MSAKTEQNMSFLDRAKLFVAGALLIGGIVAYYYYASQYSQVYRVGGIILTTVLAFVVAMQSEPGRRFWHFAQGSRIEWRKVVWPTRQETTQTAIAVFVFTLIMMLFFWALDSGLLWLTRTLVG